MGVLKPIEPLNSISLEVDGSNLHPCSVGGSVEPKIALRAQDPSDRVSLFPSWEVHLHAWQRDQIKLRRKIATVYAVLQNRIPVEEVAVSRQDDSRLMDLRLAGRRRMEATSNAIVGIAWKMEAVEMATGQLKRGSDTR
ncbi:hypothetical protein GW17_00024985 [Ensete ventricosum]|nr:hypothetical protein GW17_00024985 [Ensete ventricosum]